MTVDIKPPTGKNGPAVTPPQAAHREGGARKRRNIAVIREENAGVLLLF